MNKLKNIEKNNIFQSLHKTNTSFLLLDKHLTKKFLKNKNLFLEIEKKMNKIYILSNLLLHKLKKNFKDLRNEARNEMYYCLFFVIFCLMFLFLLERKISKDIYKTFEYLLFNMDVIFKYINKGTSEIKLMNNKVNFNKKINSKIKNLHNQFTFSKKLLVEDSKILNMALSSSELYKDALEKSNIILRLNLSKQIIYANPLFYKLSGYTKKELIGKEYSFLQSSAQDIKEIFNTIAEKGVWKGSLSNISKNKEIFYTIATIIPIKDKNEKIYEYMEIRQNITKIIRLHKEIEDRQRTIIYKMGEIAETRSKETGGHVRRVAQYSKDLALLSGMSKKEAEILFTASPMHDIGKVGIPDEILKKPGKLTKEEFEVMKTHSELGFDILRGSNEPILQAAAIVSMQHHEKYDGSGYPKGLKGEKIHIYGRITAVADVFDALGSQRVYKKAWKDEDIFALFIEQKAKHFDPILIDLFMNNLDIFINTRNKYAD